MDRYCKTVRRSDWEAMSGEVRLTWKYVGLGGLDY